MQREQVAAQVFFCEIEKHLWTDEWDSGLAGVIAWVLSLISFMFISYFKSSN